jgi:hypothetical protein
MVQIRLYGLLSLLMVFSSAFSMQQLTISSSPRRKNDSPIKSGELVSRKPRLLRSGKTLNRQLSFSEDTADIQDQDINQDIFVGVENEVTTPTISFFSNKDNIPYHMRDAYNDAAYHNYMVESFVYNQSMVIDAMNKSVTDRNAKVELAVGGHCHNKMERYSVSSIKRDTNLHGKNLVAFDCSPSKQEPKKSLLITGSANATDAIWPNGNAEVVVVVEDDHELAKEACRLVRSNSFIDDKDIVKITPTKSTIFTSFKVDLNKSRAQRIDNVAKRDGDDRIVWASTMNINDTTITNALCNAAESGVDTRLTVHKTALTKNGIPLLRQAQDKGVKVNVFSPEEGSRIIHHKKDLITNDLYIISNANFTDEGDKQKNLETYFPKNKELIEQAKQDYERVQAQCTSLEKALEQQAVVAQKKEEKKKIAIAQKKAAAEQKKEENLKQPVNSKDGLKIKKGDTKKFKGKTLKRKASSFSGEFESPIKKLKR